MAEGVQKYFCQAGRKEIYVMVNPRTIKRRQSHNLGSQSSAEKIENNLSTQNIKVTVIRELVRRLC